MKGPERRLVPYPIPYTLEELEPLPDGYMWDWFAEEPCITDAKRDFVVILTGVHTGNNDASVVISFGHSSHREEMVERLPSFQEAARVAAFMLLFLGEPP